MAKKVVGTEPVITDNLIPVSSIVQVPGAIQGLGAAGQEAQNQGSARPLEDDDLRGGTAP